VYENIQWYMALGSVQAIKSAVEAGLGVSIISRQTVKRELKYGALREVRIADFKLERDLYLVQKQHRFQKIGLETFVYFMKNRFLYASL
ncbi:LysR family transcriptional regulator, partial [Bacillaceae bacterium SIJ1]|uniref:LysR substrate-binding domain-containing protein n=1 Tax=Litoribacterium kuwaitense TaxID=1398745 RepID=UPI001FEB9B0A